MIKLADNWKDYELIDAGDKDKLERWGDIVLVRPDPQAIWQKRSLKEWQKYDAIYHRSSQGGGSWEFRKQLPEYWVVSYKDLVFKVSPTNFKHTGLFPEQAANWDWLMEQVKYSNRPLKALNLFGYTGAATMALAKAGCEETVHVDAAKGMVSWAKENMVLNHLEDHTIRFIVDDALKFVEREQRRGHKYDIILMDPPSYGRGPNKELWKLEDQLETLIRETSALLSDDPVAYLVNGYTTGFSPIVLTNLISRHVLSRYPDGKVYSVELGLPMRNSNMVLPCGISGRFER